MSKLIIYLPGRLAVNGHKRRNFLWNGEYGSYVFEGKPIEIEQFNATFDRAMKNAAEHMKVRVKVVEVTAASPAAPESVAPPAPIDPPSASKSRLSKNRTVAEFA